ncbi:hypothetical protein V8E53_010410 [Lactarius tabidus]
MSLEYATGPSISNGVNVAGQHVLNNNQMPTNLAGKRTSSSIETGPETHANPPAQTNSKAAKKARLAASSFYPGYGGVTSILDLEANQFLDPNTDEPPTEDEGDWIDDQATKMTTLPWGQREKAVTLEIPSWAGSTANTGPSASAGATLQVSKDRVVDTSLPLQTPSWAGSNASTGPSTPASTVLQASRDCDVSSSLGHNDGATLPLDQMESVTAPPTPMSPVSPLTVMTAVTLVPSESSESDDVQILSPSGHAWPSDTDIQQGTLLKSVLQDGFENLWASMLFEHAFPDLVLSQNFVCDALVTAAARSGPAMASIHQQLLNDNSYLKKLTPLPHACLSLFRAEVKDYCNALTSPMFLAMPSQMQITCYLQEQLSNYNYTFPGVRMNVGHGVLVMRSKPYRNSRIIDVIRDAFFRGSAPFTSHFNYLFPTTETHDGTIPEVPIPMVALVATALFATLYEWHSGKQVVAEFSANSHLDVYHGHVNTLNVIRERHGNAF